MTNSSTQVTAPKKKRERLIDAAIRVFYEQGVEKTTIADIARAADVPVGNVYYYFKTKDQFVETVIAAHEAILDATITALEQLPAPAQRLKAMVAGWVDQRDMAANFGCPFGTLATELNKRNEPFAAEPARVMQRLIDWARTQFEALDRDDADELAIAFIAAYQGISVLTNTFGNPALMTTEGARLQRWIDELAA
ncbi:TetR/AcrR family transcriptional regulator [Nocardia camponoti]|uniref:TetR family transcriptional regulator n=1 Tax=Nocardia camponoti TaxID=1616106 RepID=A0A917V4N8_9NOCA|nr:TetR/AcrR family transcriptional regulator [Nocardia camponoti]GGK39331.1 TetR family transcriptional regulator [Nocardia camponoti]